MSLNEKWRQRVRPTQAEQGVIALAIIGLYFLLEPLFR